MDILRKVKHPCIINLEDVIDTQAGVIPHCYLFLKYKKPTYYKRIIYLKHNEETPRSNEKMIELIQLLVINEWVEVVVPVVG